MTGPSTELQPDAVSGSVEKPAAGALLYDPWSSDAGIVLNGRLEQAAFPSWLTVMIGLVLAFVLFQGISLVVTVALLAANGVSIQSLLSDMNAVLENNARELFIANTVGQVFGLLVPALIFARLHTGRVFAFLRFRTADARLIILSVVGLFALIPVVQWMGSLSDALPWPQSLRDFEQLQVDMIERLLLNDFSLAFTLSMMALTPAFCEEFLFRGYIQRQAERSFGIRGGVLFSGIIFGLYHLRPTQAIPLSLLGIYLAWLTWRSGSLVPAIIVHFANNAFAVFVGKFAFGGESTAADLESFQFPWYVLLPAIVGLIAVTFGYHRIASALLPHPLPSEENEKIYAR